MYDRFGKRLLDLCLTIPALIISLPIQAVVAILVASKLGRPILFRQERPGLNAKSFTMIKFRSMLPVDPARGQVDDASRLTPFGAWLRSTSLDELPALWSVVRGDTSLVGPRPLLTCYLERYTPEQAQRHDVRPGLTGLAQISGRNALSWGEKLRLDVEYVKTRSVWLDLRIIGRTIGPVLARRDISAPEYVTMPPREGLLPDRTTSWRT